MGVETCVRYVMVLLNTLLMLVGIAFIGAGIYLIGKVNYWGTYSLTGVIVIGCATFLTTLCGCAGGLKESYSLLLTHTILMFLLMMLSTVVAAGIFVYKNQIATITVSNLPTTDGCFISRVICKPLIERRPVYVGIALSVMALVEFFMGIIGVTVTNHVRTDNRRTQ